MQRLIDAQNYNLKMSIRESIELNAQCADELVAKTITEITGVCREWAAAKHNSIYKLIESRSIDKRLISDALSTLFTVNDLEKVNDQITRVLKLSFEEYAVMFHFDIIRVNLTLDSKHFEKYWFEIKRTSATSGIMEELKDYCWSMALGNFPGWLTNQAILGSGNHYSLQQSNLKALLLKQIEGVLLLIEQRISRELIQEVIKTIYQYFDQREEHLRQDLLALHHTDHLASELISYKAG
jgi:hypothetical protein